MHVRSSYFILFIWIWYPVDCNWRCRHISKSIITCISNFEALYFFILLQQFFISRIVKCPGSVVVAVRWYLVWCRCKYYLIPLQILMFKITWHNDSWRRVKVAVILCWCAVVVVVRLKTEWNCAKKKGGCFCYLYTESLFFIWFWWVFSKVH